ncbi:MAG: hypothetical protein AB7L09_01980 [Nitrospira sp.]
MTTATRTFTPLSLIGDISTPFLSDAESAKLLDCINGLRSGERVYLVRVVYHKQTNARPRVAGQDYVADPALRRDAHEGILYAAPSNKRREVYLRMADGARRPDEMSEHGYTCFKPSGLASFRVLAEFPGYAAQERQAAAQAEAQAAAQAFTFNADPNVLMAQAMFAQAQALLLMGQAMLAKATR